MHSQKITSNWTIVVVVLLMIGLFFIQKIIPKMPFEHPSFYCKRTTDIPFMSTYEEYNECMRKNTGPSEEVMQYVKKTFGKELNDKQEVCMGEVIENYLSGDDLKKFLNGAKVVSLIGQNKAADFAADSIKCTKKM